MKPLSATVKYKTVFKKFVITLTLLTIPSSIYLGNKNFQPDSLYVGIFDDWSKCKNLREKCDEDDKGIISMLFLS